MQFADCGSVAHRATDPTIPTPRMVPPMLRLTLLLLLIAILLAMILFRQSGSDDISEFHQVTYRVPCCGNVSLTYTNGTGGTQQESTYAPWESHFQAPTGAFLYLSAQGKQWTSMAEVDIQIDGRSIQHAKSTDAYGIATASGRVR